MIRTHNKYGFRWFRTGVHKRLGPYVKKAIDKCNEIEKNIWINYGVSPVDI